MIPNPSDNRAEGTSTGDRTGSGSSRPEALLTSSQAFERAALLDNLSEVVFETDAFGNWTYLNRAWTAITGLPVAETLGTNFLDYVHPDEKEHTITLFADVVSGKSEFCHHEARFRNAAGGFNWIEIRATAVRDEEGRVTANTGTILDISERRKAQDLLAEHTGVLHLIAQDAGFDDILGSIARSMARHGGWVVALSSPLGAWSQGGLTAEDLEQRGAAPEARAAHETSLDVTRSPSELVVIAQPDGSHEVLFSPGEPDLRDSDPARGSLRHRVPIMSTSGQEELGSFAIYAHHELSFDREKLELLERCKHLAAIAIERRQARRAALHRAVHDPLTGVPNRMLMEDRVQQALSSARRHGRLVGVLLLDLNNFKMVNDTLGHKVGDDVLRGVATRLQASLRTTDTVCRLGGDEFAVVLPEIRGTEDAEAVSRKILKDLQQPFEVNGIIVAPEASVGLAVFPMHGEDPTALLQHADVAMYRAKGGGGGYALYEPRYDDDRLSDLELARDLREAIENDDLAVVYQPKVSLDDGRVVAVEALVRWMHPTRGGIPPRRFVSLAESTGLIRSLSSWVFTTALAESRLWCDRGMDIALAVNLSAQVLRDESLPELLERLSVRERRGGLELEISESAIMADPEGSIEAIRKLDSAGVVFAIDDFGTGSSSLSYLKRLPVRLINIDQFFVQDMARDERDASIVRSAIDLAHNLSIGVVAKGVESRRVRALLGDLGCDFAQGYHFAAPMPASELMSWLGAAGRVAQDSSPPS